MRRLVHYALIFAVCFGMGISTGAIIMTVLGVMDVPDPVVVTDTKYIFPPTTSVVSDTPLTPEQETHLRSVRNSP